MWEVYFMCGLFRVLAVVYPGFPLCGGENSEQVFLCGVFGFIRAV